MMRQPSQHLAEAVLNRMQHKTMASLLTRHGSAVQGIYLHKIGVFEDDPICRLCNEKKETAYHVAFECVALEHQRLPLREAISPL